MKILGINMSSNHQFRITDGDKLWVEENFRWLKAVFGYPNKAQQQVLFTPVFFPVTFSEPTVKVDHVVADLCKLLGIERGSVKIEIVTDIRDWNSLQYEVQGKAFECKTDLKKGDYTIYVDNNLQKHPEPMVFSLIYEFIRIRLTESGLEYDVGGDDSSLFIFLAGIYYGFGVILAQNLLDSGQSSEGTWEMKWYYGSPMPEHVMAFALATYANLTGENDPSWKSEFKGSFKKIFEEAIVFLREHPNDLYDEAEVTANDLFNEADELFDQNRLDEAISTLQKILFLTKDDLMKADVYNNMGYYYMRQKDYQQGISNFRKALVLGPEYGYANDNLGYALIMTGDLEEGLLYLNKAIETANNDNAYTYRNLALYHQRRKEFDIAEVFFQKSFDQNSSVDLLEYHYGEFLLERGDVENARIYFQKSAEKKEEEGASKLQELGRV